MAISYDLQLDSDEELPRVAEVLREIGQDCGLLKSAVTVEDVLEGTVTVGDTWVRVVKATTSFPWNVVQDNFGFIPQVWVAFRLGRAVEHFHQQDDMIRLVAGLLDRIPGDAVLEYQYEVVWLLRRGGELEVNERTDLWTPERLAMLTPPYERKTHHFV